MLAAGADVKEMNDLSYAEITKITADLQADLGRRVDQPHRRARRLVPARGGPVHRRVRALHALGHRRDQPFGHRQDGRGRAEVLQQQRGAHRRVVVAKAPDELDAGAAEAVDGLVVVADRHQLGVRSGQCAHQRVLRRAHVLVLVDEEMRRARPLGLGLQQRHRLVEHAGEVERHVLLLAAGQRSADQPQRHRMVGQHGHAARGLAGQRVQALAQLGGGAPVEGQRDDLPRRHLPRLQQPGDAVRDHPRLARSRPGQHQLVAAVRRADQRALHRRQRLEQVLVQRPVGGRSRQQVPVAQLLQRLPQRAGRFVQRGRQHRIARVQQRVQRLLDLRETGQIGAVGEIVVRGQVVGGSWGGAHARASSHG